MKERGVSIREGPILCASALGGFRGLRAWVLAGILAFALSAVPTSALALGPNAMIYPTGWDNNSVTRGDDNTFPTVNLPFNMTWNGTTYTNVNINMNGNCTFGSDFTEYNPNRPLSATGQNIMSPFWADVDTRNTSAGLCYYSDAASSTAATVDGHTAFIVTWQGVARYNNTASPLNYFQLVIVDRSDINPGDFDFWFNYDQMLWDFPTAASNAYPHAGWAFADGSADYELPGGGTSGALIDSGANALIDGTLNSGGQLGRYIFTVRSGALPNVAPNINLAFTTSTLEANTTTGCAGYSGATDAVATDGDGTVASFVRTPAAGTFLPFGSTVVTWTATDDDGAVTVATQTINVVDTTPPTEPWAWSPTHTANVWSGVGTITANWTTSTDSGTGLAGYSFSWTQDAPATPDTATDTYTYTAGATSVVTVEDQAFASATWPTDWTRSNATYARISTTRSHSAPNSAEVWANNGTRRTVNFYKTYDLSSYQSSSISFWDYRTALSSGADYEQVEYSTNGGATWTQLQRTAGASALQGWTQHTYALPTVASVRVRFSASVNAAAEYVDWDDISITGTNPTPNSVTAVTGDGAWYFNLRSVDNTGNAGAATNIGPFLIESFPPISSCNIPAGWTNSLPSVSITATDAGSGVNYTRYQYDGGAWGDYTAPFAPGVDGTHTLNYFSVDNAGHVETTRTATLQLDTTPPSAPATAAASAVSATSIEVTWTVSADAQSGVAYYAVYRDGSLVATTSDLAYTDEGLDSGASYTYYIVAYNGAASPSADSPTATAATPAAAIWMSLSTDTVDLGTVSPGVPSTVASATTVKVGGVGGLTYDLWCSATDFDNDDLGSQTPTMPVTTLSYATHGWVTLASQPFSSAPYKLNTAAGTKYVWEHDYRFDYMLTAPWANEPGTYTTTVLYTVVSN